MKKFLAVEEIREDLEGNDWIATEDAYPDLDNDEYMEYLAKFLHRKSNLYVDKDEIHNLLKIEFPTTTYKKISENRIRTRYYYPDFSGLKNIRLTGIRGFEENQITFLGILGIYF